MVMKTRTSGNLSQRSAVFLKMPLYRVSKERSGFLGGCMVLFDAIIEDNGDAIRDMVVDV